VGSTALLETGEPLRHPRRAPDGSAPDATLTRALQLFVGGRVTDQADRDDVVQETYLRLVDHQTTSRVENVKALCFAIARNLLIDLQRHRRRVRNVELDEALVCPQPTADVVVAYRRAVAILARALERMPPLRREIFFRRRLDGDPIETIAAALEMSRAAVEKHVVRALADLRGALARCGFTMEGGA